MMQSTELIYDWPKPAKHVPTRQEAERIATLDALIAGLQQQLTELIEQRATLKRGGPRRVEWFTVERFPWGFEDRYGFGEVEKSPAVLLHFRYDDRLLATLKALLGKNGGQCYGAYGDCAGGWYAPGKVWYVRPGFWPDIAKGLDEAVGIQFVAVEAPLSFSVMFSEEVNP